MKMKAKEKKKYLISWTNYINQLYTLTWTRNRALSDEVADTIKHLLKLIVRVADDKIQEELG